MVRTEPTADDSLAAIFERSKFGMAIAAMIRMIATTISNSIREKPFCFFMMLNLLELFLMPEHTIPIANQGPIARKTIFPCSRSRILLIMGTILSSSHAIPDTSFAQEPENHAKIDIFCRHPQA